MKLKILSIISIAFSLIWIISFYLVWVKLNEMITMFVPINKQAQILNNVLLIITTLCGLLFIKAVGSFLLFLNKKRVLALFVIPTILLVVSLISTLLFLIWGLEIRIPTAFYFDYRLIIVYLMVIGSIISIVLTRKIVRKSKTTSLNFIDSL